MTRPKKAEHPGCKVRVTVAEGQKDVTSVEWADSGKARISARITKALKAEGFEARADSMKTESGRICLVVTAAPTKLVQSIVGNYFLNVVTMPPKSNQEVWCDFIKKLGPLE